MYARAFDSKSVLPLPASPRQRGRSRDGDGDGDGVGSDHSNFIYILPSVPCISSMLIAVSCFPFLVASGFLASSSCYSIKLLALANSGGSAGRGRRGVVRAAKGFGEVVQRKKKGAAAEAGKPKGESLSCPCGGGDDRQEFGDCCARYHGGVVEPDALTLMKARFSAYARSKVDYVVRTTHPDNPDFRGKDELAADVRTTCEQLRFIRLEILGFETTSEDEAFVSFRVTYAVAKGGRAGDKQFLVEKSRFVKEGNRWLYIEKIPTSQASEAAWLNSTTPNPKIEQKSFRSQSGLSPRKS